MSGPNETNEATETFVDLRGIPSPLGAIRIRREFGALKSGQALRVVYNSEDTLADLRELFGRMDVEVTERDGVVFLSRT